MHLYLFWINLGPAHRARKARVQSEADEEERDRNVDHPVHKWFEAAQKEPLFNRRYKRGISGREEWWANGQEALRKALEKQKLNQNVAKNVIIFIGDGMGISTATASRIFEGNEKDDEVPGEQNFLSFEKFPYTGLAKVNMVKGNFKHFPSIAWSTIGNCLQGGDMNDMVQGTGVVSYESMSRVF